MTTDKLISHLGLEILSKGQTEREISGCFICDLLSHAMGRVEADNLWITVQTNMNIVAIATLTDLSAIIIAQNMSVPDDVIQKAEDEEITILKSDLTAYELALKIGELI